MAASEIFPPARPLVAVGAVIWNEKGEIVLIQRAKEPHKGQWSIPGGRVEWGETLHEAIVREIREETGLEVRIAGFIEAVDSIGHDKDGTVTQIGRAHV